VLQVLRGVALRRVVFGVGGDLDDPVGPLRVADEAHQLGRVAEVAGADRTAGQVAAQRDDAADLLGAVGVKDLGDAGTCRAHARQVRRRLEAGLRDRLHRVQRLGARGAAGAVGDAEELGLQRAELLHDGLQLLVAHRRVGREEFEADRDGGHGQTAAGSAAGRFATPVTALPRTG